MNIPLSLLIYNPIEAYTMILLCDVITGNNTNINTKTIGVMYLLGAVNLFFQCIPNLMYGSFLYIIINILVVFIIYPIFIYNVYTKALYNYATFRNILIAVFIENIFVLTLSSFMGLLFSGKIIFIHNNSVREFISNVVIFSLQILLYTFVKKRGHKYEKCCKRNCKKIRK